MNGQTNAHSFTDKIHSFNYLHKKRTIAHKKCTTVPFYCLFRLAVIIFYLIHSIN